MTYNIQMSKKVEQPEAAPPSEEESGNAREKEQEGSQSESASRQIEGVTIFCPLCYDYLAHSVTTFCEHTFCELCLSQYLIYLDECPECRVRIRNQKQANNILLDNLILDYIKRFEPQDLEQYEKRLNDYKDYKRRRTLNDIETGTPVDIRDPDYVWCSGKVLRTVNKYHERKIKYAVIKYDRSSKKEEIPEGSARLAPKGFFTEREDIPRYEKGKLVLRNVEQGVAYLISKQSEESEEQEQQKRQ